MDNRYFFTTNDVLSSSFARKVSTAIMQKLYTAWQSNTGNANVQDLHTFTTSITYRRSLSVSVKLSTRWNREGDDNQWLNLYTLAHPVCKKVLTN